MLLHSLLSESHSCHPTNNYSKYRSVTQESSTESRSGSGLAENQRLLMQQVQQQSELLELKRARKQDATAFDTRAIGKPAIFSGKVDDWPGWKFTSSHGVTVQESRSPDGLGEKTRRQAHSLEVNRDDRCPVSSRAANGYSAAGKLRCVTSAVTRWQVKNRNRSYMLDVWERWKAMFNPQANRQLPRIILHPQCRWASCGAS